LNDAERCEGIDVLSWLLCPGPQQHVSTATTLSQKDLTASDCHRCFASPSGDLASVERASNAQTIVSTFRQLIATSKFADSKKSRITMMIALRRILQHSKDLEDIDLDRSTLGQWCLQSLQSTVRELRIAAGRALPYFVSASGRSLEHETAVLQHNRATVLTVLKSLSDKDSPPLNETCIMAWSQLGHVLEEGELNLVLLKLLEYLGHRSTLTSSFAFNELLNLAAYHDKSPRQLFESCWKTLALSAVKDMVARPQTVMRLADLLEISVNQLLLMLQRHALPWLVLNKRRDVIVKIAEARGDSEPWMACLDSANLPVILSLLLSQDVEEVESYVLSLFRYISPYFDGLTLVDLLQAETFMTTLELLRASGEAQEAQTVRVGNVNHLSGSHSISDISQIRRALSIMANAVAEPATRRAKKGHLVSYFLQQHALGLATRFSEIINDSAMLQPLMRERQQYVRAMEEMVKLGKSYIRIARPQVCLAIYYPSCS
jgi:serine/threonine-protein kinase ATR